VTNLWANVEDLGDYAESDYAYDSVKTASFILWALSGRKFAGTTTVTERYVTPIDPYFINGMSEPTYIPEMLQGEMYNVPSGRYTDGTVMNDGSSSLTRVRLRGRKVVKVHEVRTTDGTIVDPLTYYLSDHATLSATPGASWPNGAVEVTYTYGNPPPVAGKNAARLLAIELVKMYEGDDTCALPQRVTAVTRQGVSYTILDDQAFIDELKTGIYAIDLFLKAVNPDKARARARVFSVDTPRARRLTGHPPKMPLSASDLYVSGTGGSLLLHLDEISAAFLLSDPAWVLSGTLSTWTEDRATALSVAPVLDDGDETIAVTVTYLETITAIGTTHPGVLDLYATRPSLGDPDVDEIVPVLTSNVIIQMGSPLTPVYTP
jgi:hypothetical protein